MATAEPPVVFDTRRAVDFVVIGSGAAGGILAKELATAGFDVVVLVVVLRLVTHWLGWQTPTATDLTPIVAGAPKHAVRTGGRAISPTTN